MDNPLLKPHGKRGRPSGLAERVTPAQIAEALQVAPKTVYGWLRQRGSDGKPVLPSKKFGRFVRVLVSDVEKLPERLLTRPPSSFFLTSQAGGES